MKKTGGKFQLKNLKLTLCRLLLPDPDAWIWGYSQIANKGGWLVLEKTEGSFLNKRTCKNILDGQPVLEKTCETPLHAAVSNGDIPLIRRLIRRGANPNAGSYIPLPKTFPFPVWETPIECAERLGFCSIKKELQQQQETS